MSINMQILNTKLHICTTGEECIKFWSEGWGTCIVLASKICLLRHCLLQVVVSQTFEIKVLAALNHYGIRLNQLKKKIFYCKEFHEMMSRMMYSIGCSDLMHVFLGFLNSIQLLQSSHQCPEILMLKVVSMGHMGHTPCLVQVGLWIMTTENRRVDSKCVDGFIYIAAFVYAASYVHIVKLMCHRK